MREHDAFRLARRAGSKDQRCDALRVNALRQERDAFVFRLFVGKLEDFVVSPETRESLLLELFAQVGLVFEDFLARDDAGGVSGAREVENLARRTFWIARDARRAGLQDAEVSPAPLGRVRTHEHHAIALLDSLACKKAGHARR